MAGTIYLFYRTVELLKISSGLLIFNEFPSRETLASQPTNGGQGSKRCPGHICHISCIQFKCFQRFYPCLCLMNDKNRMMIITRERSNRVQPL